VNSFSDVADSILFDDVEVGRRARIRRAIVDKAVRIPAGMEIGYDLELDRERFTVSDGGVVVIPKGMRLP
jgi:glucose-1-phosphate adenylyltransferase